MPNTSHVYRGKSGNWYVSFHHPICRVGSIGKKIHRGLKVKEEPEARSLENGLNELLALAERSAAALPPRSEAERTYGKVVSDAFYDCMTPEPFDYLAKRNALMPLPPKEGVPNILFVGPTGSGKSRLVQHILQTVPENFPIRGAGRTTVSDLEIIVNDVNYSAAITFFSEHEIRQVIKENVIEACSFAYDDSKDKRKIASKMIVDTDKRFHFNFVLGGQQKASAEYADDDENEEIEEAPENQPNESSADPKIWDKLSDYVDRVVVLTQHAKDLATKEPQPSPSDSQDNTPEYWTQFIDQHELDNLIEEILEELEGRLCSLTKQRSWPTSHQIEPTSNRADFFRALRPYYQNHRAFFGQLVTPLVQGIRVCGRFSPKGVVAPSQSTWVLIDGQGIGHEHRNTSRISKTVPPEVTQKYADADVICLVDKSTPAMSGDAPILLQDLISRGQLEKLSLVFTHFEGVNAPDLDGAAKREKVLGDVSGALQSIESLPKNQKVLLERTLDRRAYFMSRLDLADIKLKSTLGELARLCERFSSSAQRLPVHKTQPQFNEYEFAQALSVAVEGYRKDWSESELSRFQWKIMEALTNWIGNAYRDGYPKRNLFPGQDLSRRLVEAASKQLEKPRGWTPRVPKDPEEESRILNAIRAKVGKKLDAFCRMVVVQDPRSLAWLPAYTDISGPGTKIRRARTVARILEDKARLPNEGLGEFSKRIWQLIEEAIDEVSKEDDKPRPARPIKEILAEKKGTARQA